MYKVLHAIYYMTLAYFGGPGSCTGWSLTKEEKQKNFNFVLSALNERLKN